jgi:acetyl-CoA carboxylase alpha subunit
MPFDPNRRLSPEIIETDRNVLLALENIPDYAPVNPRYSVAALRAREQALTEAEQEELRIANELVAARTRTRLAALELHEDMQEAKVQAVAQFGSDSTVVPALGLKRKSERRRPTRRRPGASA